MAPDNIPICPMTGKPCFHQKTLHITEVKDYQSEVEHHMCNGCAPTYIQLTQMGQEPMLFSPQQQPLQQQTMPPHQPGKTQQLPGTNIVIHDSFDPPTKDEPPKKIPVKKGKAPKNPKYIETAEQLFDLFMMKPPGKKGKKDIACPSCGMTPQDFQKKGKMGCAECYNFYKNDIPEVLQGCQEGAVKHVGKKPKTPQGEPAEVLKTLKLKMKHAIEQEKYEEAALLKKQIASVEEKIPKENTDAAQEDHLGGTDGSGPGGTVGGEDHGS